LSEAKINGSFFFGILQLYKPGMEV